MFQSCGATDVAERLIFNVQVILYTYSCLQKLCFSVITKKNTSKSKTFHQVIA